MEASRKETKQALMRLFYTFVDAGLHGRFEEALNLMVEEYLAVGMGEQGIVQGKGEARQILEDAYIPGDGVTIDIEVKGLTISLLCENAAVVVGELIVTNTALGGRPTCSGLMQSIVCRLVGDNWCIAFTHASPTILTAESIEAYPIRFMDQTLSALRADLQADAMSHVDPLTGILNRESLEFHAAGLLENYNPAHTTALFMIDLDDFKQINDRLGHQTGDRVLQEVAASLKCTFPETDVVGRLGGDEFMVLLMGDFSVKFLEEKANTLLQAAQLHTEGSQNIPISFSVGIAYGRGRTSFDALYRIADIALYTAKKAGKYRYHLMNSDTNANRSYGGGEANLLSLQTLLDYTEGRGAGNSQTAYEALLSALPCGIAIYELGDTVQVTQYGTWLQQFTGYSSNEEIEQLRQGKQLGTVWPEDIPKMKEALRRIQEEGMDRIFVSVRLNCKDGIPRGVDMRGAVMERSSEKVTMYAIYTEAIPTNGII